MSRPTEDRAIVDAGLKALAFDSGPPLVCDEPAATHERASADHGRRGISGASNRLGLGNKIRLVPGHCDPTVNLYDWYVGIRGTWVEQLWPITARGTVYGSVEAERHDAVGPHPPVLRAEDHPLQIGLRNDEAIERIVVMRRQAAGMLGMGTGHRQDLETEREHRGDDRPIKAKLPDRPLDRDFPYCHRADDNLVRLVAHRRAQRRCDLAGPLIRPEQDVRVDQQPHGAYSKYFCTSGGRGP